MSDSFAPGEKTTHFVPQSALSRFWPMIFLGAVPIGWALTNLPDLLTGNRWPYCLRSFIAGNVVGLIPWWIAARWNWWRIKWVEVADRAGIRWFTRGQVWHRESEQLELVDFGSVYIVDQSGLHAELVDQTMVVRFDDGASIELPSKHWDKYLEMRHLLQAKEDGAKAAAYGARIAADRAKKEARARGEAPPPVRTGSDQPAKFGPLGIQRGGVEWDGIYYSWDQIEGYEVQQGFLIIRTLVGDEFLKRTADLGDWRTALERLEAAAGKMAGQRQSTADSTAKGSRKRF